MADSSAPSRGARNDNGERRAPRKLCRVRFHDGSHANKAATIIAAARYRQPEDTIRVLIRDQNEKRRIVYDSPVISVDVPRSAIEPIGRDFVLGRRPRDASPVSGGEGSAPRQPRQPREARQPRAAAAAPRDAAAPRERRAPTGPVDVPSARILERQVVGFLTARARENASYNRQQLTEAFLASLNTVIDRTCDNSAEGVLVVRNREGEQ